MRAFLFVSLAVTAFAQVQGPSMGYVPDGASLRSMYGIPAAGAIGGALSANLAVTHLSVSPSQTYALATAADSGALVVVIPGADGSATSGVTGAAAGASLIALSPNGSAAALWASGHIQVIGGLPGAGAVTSDIDASFLGADPAALAVSDDGQWVAGVFGSAVYAFGTGGQVTTLPVDAGITALAFFHGSHDMATTTATTVTRIADIGGAAAATVLHQGGADPPPTESPLALGISADNHYVVVIEPSGGIGKIDLTSGAVGVADCGCQPDGLFGMGGSIFRLTGINGGSLKVFDAATGDVWFVPVAGDGANGGQQ